MHYSNLYTNIPMQAADDSPGFKRVAAYCRVSTDQKEQESSLNLQIDTYKKIISKNPGWELDAVYVDVGLSGTSVSKRIEFQKMIEAAENGRIDIILAKSISRFARNTQDTLKYTRHLSKIGVSVYFEKEGIDTSGISSEFLLTILAAFAQEESHSISENTKRGIRNRFKLGIPMWSETYGLQKGWIINESEAVVIRLIFELFIQEKSVSTITKELNAKQYPTPGNSKKWNTDMVSRIILNEKYAGDVRMQKTYVSDYLEHKSVKNNKGVVEQFYIKDHHKAIIDRGIFYRAQAIFAMKNKTCGPMLYPYYGILKCPFCGKNMIKVKVTGSVQQNAWTCGGSGPNNLLSERTSCPTYLIQHKLFEQKLINAIKELDSSLYPVYAKTITNIAAKISSQNITIKIINSLINFISIKDFDTLIIDWKMGFKGEYKFNFSSLSEVFLPIIKGEAKKWTCFGLFVRDRKTFETGFLNRQKRILQYRVIEPEQEGLYVPQVISPENDKQ